MEANPSAEKYERRVTPLERVFSWSPYSIVTLVARIRGEVTEAGLRQAIARVRQRHPNLRARIVQDQEHQPWLSSEGAQPIPVTVVARESDNHWIQLFQEACLVPFEFDRRPALRFILARSPAESELIILCHHILCDGLSLAYLARDLMVHLGDPGRRPDPLPDPVPIDRDNIPVKVCLNPIVSFFMNRINRKWAGERVFFDQEDYRDLHQAYWAHSRHRMRPAELTEAQTGALVARCRSQGVTVNSALSIAFLAAQAQVLGKEHNSRVGVAASLRDRLPRPAGEVMGFFAGLAQLDYPCKASIDFWENARRFHCKIGPLLSDQNLFQEFVPWFHLDPSVLEARHFKLLGSLVPPGAPRHEKLAAFARREDTVASVLRRSKTDSLDRLVMGTAVTNLTRLDLPVQYGPLALERLIMNPGGAFPLATVNLVLGAVTCAGKLSLVVSYAEERIDSQTAGEITDRALGFLTT